MAARILVLPTEPYVVFALAAVAVFLCLRAGRRWEAALALGGPLLAILLNTWLLKPLYDRWKNGTLVYPSGHTVSLVAVLTVLVLLTRKTYVVVLSAVALLAATGRPDRHGLPLPHGRRRRHAVRGRRRARHVVCAASRASAVNRLIARRYFLR